MTLRSRRRGGRISARYRNRPRARSRSAGLVAFMVVALALVAAAIWALKWRRPAPPAAPAGTVADSMNAAMNRRDWSRGVDYSERLARTDPRNSGVIRNLAMATHNLAVAQTVRFGKPRPALRTSLDRIEAEMRVLALLDSAAALARDTDDWVRARQWNGEAYERLGMPLDAYQVYAEIRAREPNFTPALARMTWVTRSLMNPVAPDTTQVAYRPATRTVEDRSRRGVENRSRHGKERNRRGRGRGRFISLQPQ